MPLPISKLDYMDTTIENNYFVVPDYQRGISWQMPEIMDLMDDIMDVYKGKETRHFLGQIVTYNENREDGTKYVVDGQQRLSASLLFYSAVKSIAKELSRKYHRAHLLTGHIRDGLRDIIRDIDKIIKVDEDYGDAQSQPSLTLQSPASNEYFVKALHNRNPRAKTNDKRPVINISTAYQCFRGSLKAIMSGDEYKSSTSKVRFLKGILNAFSRSFYMSIIIVDNKQEAFTIFETLNNRGKNLATSDLVKTHLLSLAKNREESDNFHKKWSQFSDEFNDDPNILNTFLREYWIARSRRGESRDLYRPISQEVDNNTRAQGFLNDLAKLKDIYYVMLYPNNKHSKQLMSNPQLLSYYQDLKRLGFKSYHPIFIAMYYHDFSQSDMLLVAYRVISLLTRFVSITGNISRDLNPKIAKTANQIWLGYLTDAQSIKDYLNQYDVSDGKVKNALQDWNLAEPSHSQRATKYLLFNLEQYSDDNMISNFSFKDYSLVKLDSANQYQANDKDDNGFSYSDYLGDYTIIEKDLYKKNAPKIEKNLSMKQLIDILKTSGIKHNHDLISTLRSHGEWSLTDIQKRQAEFQDLAPQIWK